jgi:hypothetical protein
MRRAAAVTKATPFTARAPDYVSGSVDLAELEEVQRAEDDDEQKDDADGGHGEAPRENVRPALDPRLARRKPAP